ncbi:MAG: hypothetical protein JXO22_10415 [Phycisphaerae bacterium]|nr:hypothetical protein [Phycisphaerae bacterium]
MIAPYGLHIDKEPRRPAIERANLRAIGLTLLMYADKHEGHFPDDLLTLLDQGLLSTQSVHSPFEDSRGNTIDYTYVAGLDRENDPAGWPLAFADPALSGDGVATIVFLDAHVERLREPKFSEMLTEFKAEYEATRGVPPVIVGPY